MGGDWQLNRLHTFLPGTPVERGHLCASADAVAKAIHFQNAGASQASIPGTTTTYLGELAAGVEQDFADGKLSSKAMAVKAAVQAAEDVATGTEGVLPACTTALSCNREEAAARGTTSRYGIVGGVCAHVIPLLGLFLAMFTPEQHYYYDVLFTRLILSAPFLSTIYLDLACRYKKRFGILLADLLARGEISESRAAGIQLVLPWMHGYDHDEACQIANSGLYQVGLCTRSVCALRGQLPSLRTSSLCIGGLMGDLIGDLSVKVLPTVIGCALPCRWAPGGASAR